MAILVKTCKICSSKFQPKYSTLENTCGIECKIALFKINSDKKIKQKFKPIPKVSKKRIVENLQYQVLRKEFLEKEENRICFIDGCNNESNSIEHRAGRWGTNFLDINTWAGCCIEHNLELENNPELSKKYQLSKITGKPKI
jgi:hypothetical protein